MFDLDFFVGKILFQGSQFGAIICFGTLAVFKLSGYNVCVWRICFDLSRCDFERKLDLWDIFGCVNAKFMKRQNLLKRTASYFHNFSGNAHACVQHSWPRICRVYLGRLLSVRSGRRRDVCESIGDRVQLVHRKNRHASFALGEFSVEFEIRVVISLWTNSSAGICGCNKPL